MALSPYNSPIDPSLYSTLAFFLMIAGLGSSAYFFVEQVTKSKNVRSLSKDFSLALVSAIFMGLGMMFTMLTVGIYV
ncbi:Oidioi.mRNA.OKI2018_I69.chr1.g503.t1.cds [Oikopleura dioica]|uniref:Dolichyl-diphosphooligosaccharide-protein glycosyltransferase subunit TMEM258 n=1 Tax=Oikopleura dioica TaxID=34765 RepID=A0ABN7SK15_OIKDI|nr:Oidioi.mRNA.OKI2018_I69.chr1.g503.t1.cds [Oikopleura dioica]